MNACFVRDTVASLGAACANESADWVISYTPVGEETAFLGILPDGSLLLPQRGDGFGERLLHTAEDLFACGYSAVCLIDSDSPTVPTGEFARAARLLLDGSKCAVLGPSEDGGYYLLGLQEPIARLFEGIAWSTDVVTRQTMERAVEVGLPIEALQPWYDVDDAVSLARLHAEMFDAQSRLPRGYGAPHTRSYLAGLADLSRQTELQTGSAV